MKMKFSQLAISALSAAAIIMGCISCVNIDENVGQDYLATNQKYDIYTTSFKLNDIQMEDPDSLSAFSIYRFTFGSLRDETFGLTNRSTAFTLVPLSDSVNFGKPGTQKFISFHFAGAPDQISYSDKSQANILQNVNVYELEEAIDNKKPYPAVKYIKKRITEGVPVYSGKDSLSFNFNKEFGEKYLKMVQSDLDSISVYTKKFPGIYISTDEPFGNGGRINIFKLPVAIDDGYITGSYAKLSFSAEYDKRGRVDTTFYFYLGPTKIYDLTGVGQTTEYNQTQVALDMASHESGKYIGKAKDVFYLEGGRGVKPVVKAAPIKKKLTEDISKHGDPSKVVICKATMTMPFVFPENYKDIYQYPAAISPTCRIVKDNGTIFAGITDSSISGENQGLINQSRCIYTPDMTYHIQELVNLKDESKISNYDVWFLAMSAEVVSDKKQQQTNAMQDEYMRNLAYASYYNNMYGNYGYGGMGYGGMGYGGMGYGMGGYGMGSYGFSNYYNYLMISQMYNAQHQNKKVTKLMMDPNRYYKAKFKGPQSEDGPYITITYALPKE